MMISRRQFLIAMGAASMAALGGRFSAMAQRRQRYVSIMGATSCIPFVKAYLPQWEHDHPGMTVAVTGGGSYAGLRALGLGQADIAMADLAPPPGFLVVPVQRYPLGRLPIVLVAGPQVGIRGLSWNQARAVFAGDIVNWRELGGANLPVIAVSRPESSGARDVMQHRILGARPFSPHCIIQLSNGAVMRTVVETPGAIGYVEATAPLREITVLTLQGTVFDPTRWQQWPLYAEPALYLRAQAPKEVKDLAAFLQSRPGRRQFGFYAASEQGFVYAR
ncbi:substrate-binding domain-containing protein [Sulfobacillus sp. hq2]|uniref:substrate-binding domain-containing protein n=1 Tax=Sulfobacillus sp. hq2 TaxID=2039167 RepID=UPI000CD29DE7|nr:substrate-binding domain-containing protein [Sulfobacillus sp. hq2]POB11107.1 phosphate ABC transporter substrate-binding protein [Sulfobacillus sp. hq2]